MSITDIVTILTKYWPSILLGIRTTVIIALVGTGCGFLLGLLVGGIKAIKLDLTASTFSKVIKKIADIIINIYITVFRGTPMMVQAVFIYYALLDLIHWDSFTAACVVITINTGAYMAEIIRSGIQAVDIGQTEAARSLGMSNAQTMFSVVLPQAIKNAFPAIGNELIVNIKDTSVLMIISITELMFQSKSIAGSTFKFTTVYFIEAMIYLVLTSVSALILNFIEKNMNKDVSVSVPMSTTEPNSASFIKTEEQKGGNSDYVSR